MTSLPNMTRRLWVRSLMKLGLIIDKNKGKGSHYRIINPKTRAATTLPYHCHPMINRAIYKQLLKWGFSEQEIRSALSS